MDAACGVALSLDADLVITSTSDVYGNATPPFSEDGDLVIGPPTTKRWAYAVSKMYDEHYALALADEKDLRVTILRLFNAYGPRNHLSWWGGPVVTFVESLLDGEPMEIHGDGLQTRTFTYVTDTADGIIRALERPDSRGEVINLGGTETVTIQRLAELVQEKLGFQSSPLRARHVSYESLPGKYQDVIHRVPNTAKAERLLGFKATVGLEAVSTARSPGTATCAHRAPPPEPEARVPPARRGWRSNWTIEGRSRSGRFLGSIYAASACRPRGRRATELHEGRARLRRAREVAGWSASG